MKTKLQPSAKLNIKPVLIYSCAGIVGAILIGIGAFFYFNVGTSTISEAATAAEGDVIRSTGDGEWDEDATWSPRPPNQDRDRIIIENGHTVTIDENGSFNGDIIVNGELSIEYARLRMDADSRVAVNEGGGITFSPPEPASFFGYDYTNATGYITIGTVIPVLGGYLGSGIPIDGGNPKGTTIGGGSHFGPGADALLPIDLISFDAQLNEASQVAITWATASEENNDFFAIERSIDGQNFFTLDTIKGAGNSNSLLEYEYVDKYPVAGTNYYRLKQTDYDGKFEYFKIASVYNETVQAEFSVISLGPNPYKDHFEVNFVSGDNNDVHLKLMDMQGKTIFSKSLETQIGENSYIYYDQANLQPGVYLFTIVQKGTPAKTFRVVKNS